ncbi:ATP-binding protein [Sphingobium sp. HWE2-09]|uniref:ATP-binding protein n=1 Tax=Sphingobium sp. HWE2-09 TaxID=3108390 RepID=UPI002DD20CEC|nr:ATP-binding protein [Sphingobium sp. HWE2-09]
MPDRQDCILLLVYAAGFWLAHWAAGFWGGAGYYSLWFPAAGLRFALLWHGGARLTPAIVIVEILVNLAKGLISFTSPDWPILLLGIVRPVIAYGATIGFIRWLASGSRADVLTPPMPFGLAAVTAPNVAALSALPQALIRPELTEVQTVNDVITSLAAFTVGDLLGVLIVAPPLLWIADLATWRRAMARMTVAAFPWHAIVESSGLLIVALVVTELLRRVGLGVQPMPAVLAVAWTGLRFGRAAAWLSLLAVTVLVLPYSAMDMGTGARLQLHLGLATVVVVGYLAGSFSDAQKQARTDVERRDRLLFQAERLKTLRAMSVAVIHEISQPLSTLAIEARHLHGITAGADEEIAESAALIDRKAATLSDLVRRLRRYGGRSVDEPTPLPVTALIAAVAGMIAPEARAAGVTLSIDAVDPDLVVMGQEIELSQALMNLLRNAVEATGDGLVRVITRSRDDDQLEILVLNRYCADILPKAGMGVGTLVSRAIVEAHGGALTREISEDGDVRAAITLPLKKVSGDE